MQCFPSLLIGKGDNRQTKENKEEMSGASDRRYLFYIVRFTDCR